MASQVSGRRIPGSRVTALSSAPARHPRAAGRPQGSVATPPQPFHFRVCVGVCRGGAQGDAGARGARRAEGKGGLVRSPFSQLAPLTSRRLLLNRCESWGTSGSRRCSPLSSRTPVRKHAAYPQRPPPPTVGVGQRRSEPKRGRKGAASRGGQLGSGKRNFSLPPPARSPPVRTASREWELHLSPGREVRAGLWGYLEEEYRATCIGVPFSLGLLLLVDGV